MNYIKLYHDLSGAFVEADNDIVVGRSHLSNKLQLITPVTLAPDTDIMQVYFVLTNEQVTPKRTMSYIGTETYNDDTWNVYEYVIPSSVLSVITSDNSNTLKVQFRHARQDATLTYYENVLAFEMDLLTINAAVVPDDDDIVIAIDDYDDLAAQIATKQNKDWSTYTTKTTLNDTDYITIADGDVVSHRVNIGNLITHLQADYSTLEGRVDVLEDSPALNSIKVKDDTAPTYQAEMDFIADGSRVQFSNSGAGDAFNYEIDQSLKTTDNVEFTEVKAPTLALNDTNKISWNEDDLTADLVINSDVTLQIGQELHIKVKNVNGVIPNGTPLMIDSTNPVSGNNLNVVKANILSAGFFPQAVIGVATEELVTHGHCTAFGNVGMDTTGILDAQGQAVAEGDILYVSSVTGGLVGIHPSTALTDLDIVLPKPLPRIQLGMVEKAGTSGRVRIRPDLPKYLAYLNDVQLTSSADGDILVKNGSVWENISFLEESNTKIKSSFLPSYVDDVVEYADFASLPASGETGKLYVTLEDNGTYRWSGTAYVNVSGVASQTGTTTFDGMLVGQTDVQGALDVLDDHSHSFAEVTSKPTTLDGFGITDAYTQTELDAKFAENTTTLQIEKFTIDSASPVGYTLDGTAYTFNLVGQYVKGSFRTEVKYNNETTGIEKTFYPNDEELSELGTTGELTGTIQLDTGSALNDGDEIYVKFYQGSDVVITAVDATNTTYNNTTSGLTATNVQDGIDELSTEKVDEAPIDTKQYVRVDGAWVEVDIPEPTTVSDTEPVSPTEGQLWFDTVAGSMYIYYGGAWVDTDTVEVTKADYSTTILTTDTWVDQTGYFTLNKTITGIQSIDEPIVDLDLSSATVANIADIQAAWGTIYRVVTLADSVTFYATEAPVFPEDTVVDLMVVR